MLGKKLKEMRELRGLTQSAVATYLNIKRQTYSAYERAISVPDANTLTSLANLFQVSADYLLGRVFEMDLFIDPRPERLSLSEDSLRKIEMETERLKSIILHNLNFAYGDESPGDETHEKVMRVLESSLILASREAQIKYGQKKN